MSDPIKVSPNAALHARAEANHQQLAKELTRHGEQAPSVQEMEKGYQDALSKGGGLAFDKATLGQDDLQDLGAPGEEETSAANTIAGAMAEVTNRQEPDVESAAKDPTDFVDTFKADQAAYGKGLDALKQLDKLRQEGKVPDEVYHQYEAQVAALGAKTSSQRYGGFETKLAAAINGELSKSPPDAAKLKQYDALLSQYKEANPGIRNADLGYTEADSMGSPDNRHAGAEDKLQAYLASDATKGAAPAISSSGPNTQAPPMAPLPADPGCPVTPAEGQQLFEMAQKSQTLPPLSDAQKQALVSYGKQKIQAELAKAQDWKSPAADGQQAAQQAAKDVATLLNADDQQPVLTPADKDFVGQADAASKVLGNVEGAINAAGHDKDQLARVAGCLADGDPRRAALSYVTQQGPNDPVAKKLLDAMNDRNNSANELVDVLRTAGDGDKPIGADVYALAAGLADYKVAARQGENTPQMIQLAKSLHDASQASDAVRKHLGKDFDSVQQWAHFQAALQQSGTLSKADLQALSSFMAYGQVSGKSGGDTVFPYKQPLLDKLVASYDQLASNPQAMQACKDALLSTNGPQQTANAFRDAAATATDPGLRTLYTQLAQSIPA